MLKSDNQNSALKTPFKMWVIAWLGLSGFLILDRIIIWAVKGQHPSAGTIAHSFIHELISSAIFAWLFFLPNRAWWVALGALVTSGFVGFVFLLTLEMHLALSPLADAIVTEGMFFLNYLVIAGSVAVWLKRRAGTASA